MKKIGLFVTSIVFMLIGTSSVLAADVVNDGPAMGFFELTRQTDIDACTSTGKCANYWAKLKTSDGQVVYCRDVERVWPEDGDQVTYSDEIDSMDPGLIYILENGYPNKTIVDGGDKDRYITQGAIWLYVTNSSTFVNNFNDPENLLPKMQNLALAAKNASSSGTISSGTINSVGAATSLKLSGNYYISDMIKPDIKGVSTYKVSLSGIDGAEVRTANGGESNGTFNVGDGFMVRVPASAGNNKSLKVTVSITSKAHMISPVGTNEYQRVIGLSTTDKAINESITLKTVTPQVCVNYVIVGDVKPDPALTDPTPETNCYDKGTKYTQEKELTTRTNCQFLGWFTKDVFTGKLDDSTYVSNCYSLKDYDDHGTGIRPNCIGPSTTSDRWTDGTMLNNDLTLYGAWVCPTVVDVPATAAQTPLIILGFGLILIAGGTFYYLSKNKKSEK